MQLMHSGMLTLIDWRVNYYIYEYTEVHHRHYRVHKSDVNNTDNCPEPKDVIDPFGRRHRLFN